MLNVRFRVIFGTEEECNKIKVFAVGTNEENVERQGGNFEDYEVEHET